MKKSLFFSLFFGICYLALICSATNLYAQQGGFRGPGANVITIAEARMLRDDTPVILRGRIVRSLRNEKYVFSDETGNITVEIDRRIRGSLSVTETETVEISGEIDRDSRSIEVEVRSIRRL